MKAKLFEAKSSIEVRLENGVQFFANEGEDAGTLVERVTETVERDYVDTVEFNVVDSAKLKKKSSKQLQNALAKAKDGEAAMIADILEERGIEVPTAEEDTAETAEEATTSTEEKPKAEPKPKKEPKPKQTLEEALEEAQNAREQFVGKVVDFEEYRTKNNLQGIAKQVWIDRRVPMVLVKVKLEDGTIKNKRPIALVINEEATEAYEAALKEAEEAKLKEKEEAKAAKKKAKEEAKAAAAEVPATEEATESTEE